MNVHSSLRIFCVLCGILIWSGCSRKPVESDATGVFEAVEVLVSSEAGGRIVRFDVEEGSSIALNQQIGIVDTVPLVLKRQELVAGIRASQSHRPDVSRQMAVLKQQLVTAAIEKNRMENLIQAGAGTQKQLDDINAQISLYQSQLDALQNNLDITLRGISAEVSVWEQKMAQLDDQLLKCRIVNPMEGVVLIKYAEAGEVTTPGKPLYKVADMQHMILRAYLTNGQLSEIKLGQTVRVLADQGEEQYREYSGTLSWISDKAEFTPKTIQTRDEREHLVYAVKIQVPNDGFLKIGMYGEVQWEINGH